ncbi:MAG TPA: hypothetical protein VHS78_09905 [Candidatus Elarobacter sp.]|nr:hypothetical protein [Candidatus Elarobacter sp.]
MSSLSRVVVERVARCPFSVAHDYAEEFLRDIDERGAEVRVRLRDFIPTRRGKVRRRVRIVFERRLDETEAGRPHDAVALHWSAGTRLFPDFHGTLRLRIASVDETLLTLEGEYRPPLGPFGTLFDVLVGRRIARSTMRELVGRIAKALERREAAYRAREG